MKNISYEGKDICAVFQDSLTGEFRIRFLSELQDYRLQFNSFVRPLLIARGKTEDFLLLDILQKENANGLMIELCSDVDYENLVADITFQNRLFFTLIYENSLGDFEVIFQEIEPGLEYSLDGILGSLIEAKLLMQEPEESMSVFPSITGSVEAINASGQEILDGILTDPQGIKQYTINKHLKFYSQDGRGAFFKNDGTFRGFLSRDPVFAKFNTKCAF